MAEIIIVDRGVQEEKLKLIRHIVPIQAVFALEEYYREGMGVLRICWFDFG